MTVSVAPYIDPSRNKRAVYATMMDDDTSTYLVGMGHTLDFCISYANEHGLVMSNAQDILLWLHKNIDITPCR